MRRYLIVAAFIILLVLGAHFADAKTKKKRKLVKEVVPPPTCVTADDCPYTKCQTASCVEGRCTSERIVCPAAADACTYSLGCDPISDVCRYSQLACDDANPCTVDQCVRNSTEHSYCTHTPMAGCDNSATHAVSFRVENANHLNVQVHDNSMVEFCQSSTLVGVDTSVVIGFDQYVPCKLHERGTCDNKPSVAAVPSTVIFDNTYDDGDCSVDGLSQTMSIDGISSSLFWSFESDATFTAMPLRDGQQIHGYLVDTINSGLVLRVDIVLRPVAGQTVVRELEEECYSRGNIDTTAWITYEVASGTISAAHDTQYMGLVYRIANGYAQTGHGASGRNLEWGMYLSVQMEIASQPYDKMLAIDSDQATAVLRSNLVQKAAAPIDHCALFDEPRQETINGWVPTYNPAMHSTTYCRNFTMNELLKCRAFGNQYASLFAAVGEEGAEGVNFAGTVYQTTVQPRSECSVWSEGTCGERIVSSTSYNITIVSNATGVRRVDIVHSDFEFDIRWVENRWMCCGDDEAGNLRVIVETTVSGDKRQLINPRINFADETGYPLVFEDDEAPPCEDPNGPQCVQRWSLRTYGGAGVLDFSGVKPLLWDVYERRSIIAHVTATMTLRARHVGSQIHLDDGRVGAQLIFYSDRSLHTRYDMDKAPDGTPLFGALCLNHNRHLNVLVNEVAVCYSLKHDLSDGQCDKRVLLYSRTNDHKIVNASIHAFEFITNPPSGSHCVGFSFLTRAYTKYQQTFQVDYSVQESTGDGGLIELWHDDDDDDDDDWPHHHSINYGYSSYCLPPRTFDWDHHHCHEWHDDDDSVVIFGLVFIGIIIFFVVGCVATSQVSNKPKRDRVYSPQEEVEHEYSGELRHRSVKGQFKI